ncbi:MAG: hypothetical protein Q4D32_04670 [Eubacteriales bacterium]|nr:hypothetical protein [Eubacteriales bacterium]
MKSNRKFQKRGKGQMRLVCGVILACFLGMAGSVIISNPAGRQSSVQAKMLTGESENYRMNSYQAGDLNVSVHIGLRDNMVQVGRYAPVTVEIKNYGKDFSGSFRMYVNPMDDYGTTQKAVVEKKVQIAAGETKQYSMIVKITNDEGMQTSLCDGNGKILGKKYMEISTKDTVSPSEPTIGFISEDSTALAYMKAEDGVNQLYDVQDWMLTEDFRTLDLFDILLINQFDTSQLSEKQITAVIDWVEQGGTLIFGTGTQPEKTLKAFSGTLLKGTIGSTKKVQTKYGTDLDISQLEMQDAEAILSQNEDTLISRMDYGNGCVMVAGFDLNISQENFGAELQTLFYKKMSDTKRQQLTKEQQTQLESDAYDYSEYTIPSGLGVTEVNGLPNIALYAVLLLLYAILIGPILYSVLRKKGKRELLWKLIPVSAVIFSVLIYLIGTSTRVKHPYMNYLSQIDLSDQNASIDTYFALTSPNNDRYEVEIAGKKDIFSGTTIGYSGYLSLDPSSTDYQYGIEYTSDKTVLHMDNMAAFDTVRLQEHQSGETKGRIEFTDIQLDAGDLGGIVTNQTDYNLEDCVIVCNGDAMLLGDMKQGESISLDQLDASKAWIRSTSYLWTDVAEKILDYGDDFREVNVKELRRMTLLDNCGYQENAVEYYFYGFLAADQETAFTKQFDTDVYAENMVDLDVYGETAVIQRLFSEDLESNAQNVLGTLDQYIQDYPDEITNTMELVDTSIKEVKVTYDLSDTDPDSMLQLRYRNMGNQEFALLNSANSIGDAAYVVGGVFLGEVSAVNQKSGKSEVLFTSGTESLVQELSKYIDEKGKLELTYQIGLPDQSSYIDEYTSLRLPRLILERRNAQ